MKAHSVPVLVILAISHDPNLQADFVYICISIQEIYFKKFSSMYTAYGIVKPAQVFVFSVWDTEFMYNEMIKLPFEGNSSFTNTTSIKPVLPVLMLT